MDRDTIIERLIAADLEKLHVGQYSRRLLQVVEREFRSFGRMSDAELAQELARRGLASGPLPDPVDYDYEDDDEDEDEDDDEEASWLVQGMCSGNEDWASSRR